MSFKTRLERASPRAPRGLAGWAATLTTEAGGRCCGSQQSPGAPAAAGGHAAASLQALLCWMPTGSARTGFGCWSNAHPTAEPPTGRPGGRALPGVRQGISGLREKRSKKLDGFFSAARQGPTPGSRALSPRAAGLMREGPSKGAPSLGSAHGALFPVAGHHTRGEPVGAEAPPVSKKGEKDN